MRYSQTFPSHVKIFDQNKQEIACYSYQELGIDINSRLVWDSEVLSRLIWKQIAHLHSKQKHKQLSLW